MSNTIDDYGILFPGSKNKSLEQYMKENNYGYAVYYLPTNRIIKFYKNDVRQKILDFEKEREATCEYKLLNEEEINKNFKSYKLNPIEPPIESYKNQDEYADWIVNLIETDPKEITLFWAEWEVSNGQLWFTWNAEKIRKALENSRLNTKSNGKNTSCCN